MNRDSLSLLLAGFFVAVGLVSSADAQTDATQVLRIAVPSQVTVSVPSRVVRVKYDGGSRDQALPRMQWQARANAINGTAITFATNHAFWHSDQAGIKCDVRLDLTIASADAAANWSVTSDSRQTDYRAAVRDETATVKATSSRPGAATFNLTVTLIAAASAPALAGDYQLQVTATIVAK